MKTDNNFIQGYACAISCITRGHGSGTDTKEALEACGLTSIEILKKYKVAEYDIEILRPQIEEIQRSKRYINE